MQWAGFELTALVVIDTNCTGSCKSNYYTITTITDPITVVKLKSSWMKILKYTTLCDKVCQWLATGRLFSVSTMVSFTNKTDIHNIAEILLKVV
jgi:hypothetical protein